MYIISTFDLIHNLCLQYNLTKPINYVFKRYITVFQLLISAHKLHIDSKCCIFKMSQGLIWPPKFSLNCTAKRYVNCYTFWSLTCVLITLISLCNCRWLEELFHSKKTIGVYPNIQSCQVYTHTVGITGVGDPHSCCT